MRERFKERFEGFKREIFSTFDLKDFEIRTRENLDGIRRKI